MKHLKPNKKRAAQIVAAVSLVTVATLVAQQYQQLTVNDLDVTAGNGYSGDAIVENNLTVGAAIDAGSLNVGQNFGTAVGAATIGFLNSAMGLNSVSSGSFNSAPGENAAAFGEANNAPGKNAAAFGEASNASGANSFAVGESSQSIGQDSFAAGGGAEAKSFGGVALGVLNHTPAGYSSSTYTGSQNDLVLVVGNGDPYTGSRSNALEIYQDGTVIIPTVQGDIPMYAP